MNIVAIIQARMGSTRLPGKALIDVEGKTMLERVVGRVQQTTGINSVVVATTVKPADDAIVTECRRLSIPVFRGDEQDVLDRYYRAALAHHADVVVRITSDCPLIDPDVISQVVQMFISHQPNVDYVANTLPPRTFPRGLDVEVMSFESLSRAWREDKNQAWREHVTPYIYRTDHFKLLNVTNSVDYSAMRWTVDMLEDLALVRRIYAHFGERPFNWRDVLALLAQHPDWLELNRFIQQKKVD